MLWWDIRKLGEPSDSLMLEDKADGRKMGGVSMEYSAAAGPTKFLVGTEQGKVISCNRKAKNPSDRLGLVYEGHCGPVYALQRNPFFPKYFLTVGDWTARVWCEDVREVRRSCRREGEEGIRGDKEGALRLYLCVLCCVVCCVCVVSF